jgi:small subunit ribosomal protein S6
MAKVKMAERPYESLFICPVDVPQTTIDAFIEKLKSTLTQVKATIRGVQVWGRRRLSYPIKHQRDGLYIYVDYNGPVESVAVLNNLFRVSDLILRHIITERVEIPPPYVRKTPATGEAAQTATAGAVAAAAPAGAPTNQEPPSA